MDQGPFFGAIDLPLFCTLCDPPHGFQSQGGSLACTLTCLCMVNLRVMSGTKPNFSTNRGVHCTSMNTVGSSSRHPSGKQWRVHNGGLLTWAAVRFDFMLPARQANVLSTRPRWLAYSIIFIYIICIIREKWLKLSFYNERLHVFLRLTSRKLEDTTANRTGANFQEFKRSIKPRTG